MASKRKEIEACKAPTVSEKGMKKPKRDRQADKLQQQLKELLTALKRAPITAEVEKMLELSLPLSLGEFCDQRQPFQQQVVDAVAGILEEALSVLNNKVADVKSRLSVAVVEKASLDKESSDEAESLNQKVVEARELKVALAETAMGFREATRLLAAAKAEQAEDGKKSQEANAKRMAFEAGLEHLRLLKIASPEEAATGQMGDDLMALMQKYRFEESMMIALPAALAKAPDARGQFDLMAMTELEGELSKLIAEQMQIISEAAPSQQKCEEAVVDAEKKLAQVRAEQRIAARAFDVASEAQKTCEVAAAEAQKASRELSQLCKHLEQEQLNAEVEVELFEQGPRETFKELAARSTPPVVEEKMEDSSLPAAVPEEQVQLEGLSTTELQMPIAAC